MKRRVLIVGQHFWPESFRVNDIANYFIERGCEVDVLCGIPNYPEGRFYDGYSYFKNRKQNHNGINITRVFEIPRGNNTNLRIFLNYISFPIASLFHIPRLLTKEYDKIFLYQLSPVMMSIAGIIVGKIKKTETTMYVLDLWPENLFSVLPIKNSFLRKIVAGVSYWHYRKVNKIVAMSEAMKLKLIEVTGVPPDKITVLPQTCEKIYESDIDDKSLANRFSKGFNIVFAGNISPAQSFETIIAAAKRLKKDGLKDINWIIVGDGMSRKQVEKMVRQEGLSDNFYFEGFKAIDKIPGYTTIADLLIACLVRSELLEATIPAKVMSYFAAGKPIVLAMDGEVQDLVNTTIKCGYAGPTENDKILAENIKSIYELPVNRRQEMGRRGRKYHFQHFERNIILGKLFDFIFK